MKKLIFILFVGLSSWVNAQVHEPVKWETSTEKIKEGEYKLIATANIESGWHLYSQHVSGGPIPTSFLFEDDGIELVGEMSEEKGIEKFDRMFNTQIKYFEKKAVFTQVVKASKGKRVFAEVEFMVCDDTKCLPPAYGDLEFLLN